MRPSHLLVHCALLALAVSACGNGGTGADAGPSIDVVRPDGASDTAPNGDGDSANDAPTATDTTTIPDDGMVDTGVDASTPFNPACIAPHLLTATDATFAIPSTSGAMGSVTYQFCPTGANPTSTPPTCTGETHLSMATLTPTVTPSDVTLTGTLPFRTQDVPTMIGLGICSPSVTFAINGDGACPAGTVEGLPVSIAIHIVATEGDALQVNMLFDTAAVGANLQTHTQLCGVNACSSTCCISNPCACALAGIASWSAVRSALVAQVIASLQASVAAQIEARLCATNTAGPCPSGTTADATGICRHADHACAPSAALFASGC